MTVLAEIKTLSGRSLQPEHVPMCPLCGNHILNNERAAILFLGTERVGVKCLVHTDCLQAVDDDE